MARRAEGHALCRDCRIGTPVGVGREELRDIDELGRLDGLAGPPIDPWLSHIRS